MTPMQLIDAREALHLSQVDLARALGVAANTVNRWEKGQRPIPSYLWLALEGLHHQHCSEYQIPSPVNQVSLSELRRRPAKIG